MTRRDERQAGATLVVVLAALLILLSLGSVFLRLMGTGSTISATLVTRTRALYLAEAGAQAGAVYLEDHPDWPTYLPRAPVSHSLAGGTIAYRLDTTASVNQARITATGTIAGSERQLEVWMSK
jgi:Tfp pilus assembly protein PilX